MYTYKSPPGAVLHHHDPAAVMPAGQLGTALAAVVVHVLEGAHQVRDTSETAAEAENGRPATIEFVSFRDWIWGCGGGYCIAGIAPDNTSTLGALTGLFLQRPLLSESFRAVRSTGNPPAPGRTAAHARVWRWHSHSAGRRECNIVQAGAGPGPGWGQAGQGTTSDRTESSRGVDRQNHLRPGSLAAGPGMLWRARRARARHRGVVATSRRTAQDRSARARWCSRC